MSAALMTTELAVLIEWFRAVPGAPVPFSMTSVPPMTGLDAGPQLVSGAQLILNAEASAAPLLQGPPDDKVTSCDVDSALRKPPFTSCSSVPKEPFFAQ